MAYRLEDLETVEVSLVDNPANLRRFLVFKSLEGGEKDLSLGQIEEEVKDQVEKEQDVKKGKGKKGASDLKLDDVIKGDTLDLTNVPEEVRDMVSQLWKNQKEANQRAEDSAKKVEEVQKQAEEIQKKADEIQKKLEEQEQERIKKEYIEKAKGFKNLPVKAEEFGLVMKKLNESSPEEYKVIEKLLKSVDESLRQSSLFKEMGSESHEEISGDSWGKIEAMAKEMVQKNHKLTKEMAVSMVIQQNPELYREYLKESGR